MATDVNYGVEKGVKSEQWFQHQDNAKQAPTNPPLPLRTPCSAGFSSFPRAEVQGRGANAEDQGGGWAGAGEEVLRADGEHAPQEGGGC